MRPLGCEDVIHAQVVSLAWVQRVFDFRQTVGDCCAPQPLYFLLFKTLLCI